MKEGKLFLNEMMHITVVRAGHHSIVLSLEKIKEDMEFSQIL